MTNRRVFRSGTRWSLLAIALVAGLVVGCNLGGTPEGTPTIPVGFGTPTTPIVTLGPLQVSTNTPGIPQATVPIGIPTTAAPTQPLLANETLGPITIQGTGHVTQEAVTIKVRRGSRVTGLQCTSTHQDTSRSVTLGAPTSLQIDANTFEDTLTFTPDAAGVYTIRCTGVAQTQAGVQNVNATSPTFTVEAKGQ